MSGKLFQSFIDATYINAPGADTFQNINPATGRCIGEQQFADSNMIASCIKSSQRGFEIWSATPAVERARILQKAAQLLRERNDELATLEVEDTGKPWQEASVVDIQTGADAIEYFANLATSISGDQQSVGDDFFYTRHEPLGICLGIGAWNYPLQIACWKAAPALAAGNAMIFKPSEETPQGALQLAQILVEAGVPAGVFNVILGDGKVGEALTKHPDIAKVSFTGEVGTGKKVMTNAAADLKPVTMELGGKSPLIVFEDADIEEAVDAAMVANFYTQGEVCTHGTRVFVQKAHYELFLTKLKAKIKDGIVLGDPMLPATNLGALISKSHLDKVLSYIDAGVNEGASILVGGKQQHPDGCENGFFVEPTVFIDCNDEMSICCEEIFGPVMTILPFIDEEDVITRANNTSFGLAAGVFTSDVRRAHRVVSQLEAGICWINAYGNSPVEMPVGGYKLSGMGRENGIETYYHYTQTKSVYVGMSKVESPF